MNLRQSASVALSAALLPGLVGGALLTPEAAHAALSDSQIESLNPRRSKYGTCPTDSPCYILETRIIRAKVADPSESGGDENYILPIWAIVDGMGVDPHPLATGSDDFFRVNVARRTIGGTRGSNLGSMFWDRETNSWVDLQSRAPEAYKLHENKDFVIPLSRERWTSEGLIFSVNMMEHDFSLGRDIDRSYLQAARKVQAGLLKGATQARVSINSPTYYGDAIKATTEFVKKAAPIAAKAYAAAQTGGAAGAATETASSVNLDQITSMFKSLWQGLSKLDKDDVGQQVSVYIPFSSLQPGVEKRETVCGKTDPTAFNTGKFCVEIGVKLTPYSNKRTLSAFDRAAKGGSDRNTPGNTNPPANTGTTSTNPGPSGGANPQDTRCDNPQTAIGIWSLKDPRSNKFVRGGVTAEGRNDVVGALAPVVTNPNRAWESFRIYGVPGMPGLNRIQNTIDGRWLETVNTTNTLLLHGPARQCSTTNKDMQWQMIRIQGGANNSYKLINARTKQYVKVEPNGLLKANASRAEATAFIFQKY